MQTATLSINGRSWTVLVATTPAELQQGLSGVESLDPNTGMLFDTGVVQQITVTCEQMLFPIGVVFFGSNMVITEVVSAMEPGDSYTSLIPARFFVEVNPDEIADITSNMVAVIEGYVPPEPVPANIIQAYLPAIMGLMVIGVIPKLIEPRSPSG